MTADAVCGGGVDRAWTDGFGGRVYEKVEMVTDVKMRKLERAG